MHFLSIFYMNPLVGVHSTSGEVNDDIVVEMKPGEKPNEESGLLNKPHVEQVRGQWSKFITIHVLCHGMVPWELK